MALVDEIHKAYRTSVADVIRRLADSVEAGEVERTTLKAFCTSKNYADEEFTEDLVTIRLPSSFPVKSGMGR